MSPQPERSAFKECCRELSSKEILHGELSTSGAKGESQKDNNATESLIHREPSSVRVTEEETTHQTGEIFTDDQIANLTGFFDVLKRIHIRLAVEGYKITPESIEAPTTRFVDA